VYLYKNTNTKLTQKVTITPENNLGIMLGKMAVGQLFLKALGLPRSLLFPKHSMSTPSSTTDILMSGICIIQY
jgi:hypothetical protein